MITLPFANALGSLVGAGADGVHIGEISKRVLTGVLAGSKTLAPSRVVRGEAASGGITYTDITAAALSESAGDVSLFNSTDTADDEIQITVPSSGEVAAILVEITTAGVGAGTWVPVLDYDNGTAETAVPLAASPPDYKSMGVARIALATPLAVTTSAPRRFSGSARGD